MKQWTAKPSMDTLHKAFAPFATDLVAYVAVDGSNQVAVSATIHDIEGMMAFTQTPEAAANMEAGGVIQPTIFHIEASSE